MAFKLKKANYQAFKKMSMSERVATTHDSMGVWLLSLMTPTQIAELFPRYYKDSLPNITGFTQAMPTSMSIAKQQAIEEQLNNTASGSAAGANYDSGGWKKKWQQGVDRAVATNKKVIPPPQLSPEQQTAWNDLKKGPISASDDRMKMLKGLDDAKLASMGISRYTENGQTMIKYTSPNFTDEEVTNYMKNNSGSGGKSFTEKAAFIMRKLQNELGISKAQAAGVVGSLSAETGGFKHHQEMLSADKIAAGWKGGIGWAQWTDTKDDKRRTKFLNYAATNGLDPTSDAANVGFLIQELKTSHKGELARLRTAGTAEEAARLFTGSAREGYGYLRPGVEHYGRSISDAQKAMSVGDPITADYSEKGRQIARERMISEAEARRSSDLAKYTTSEPMQETPSPPIVSGKGAKVANWLGESKQCVALSKHFSDVGPASKWNVGGQEGIVPGAIIATTSYNDGSGGKMAKNMPDGKSHYHTGIALTKPDADGNVLILDQHAGRGTSINRININNYNGEKWGLVNGGEPSDKSMKAIEMAKTLATPEQIDAITNQTINVTAVQNTPIDYETQPPVKSSKEEPQDISIPKTEVNENKSTGNKLSDLTRSEPMVATPSPAIVEPPRPKNVFKFDKEAYLEEVGRKTLAYAPIIGPGREYVWRETLKGFNEAQKAGIIKYDEKTGTMTINDMNHPKVQEIYAEMAKHKLDRNVFMKEDQPKVEPKVENKQIDRPTPPEKERDTREIAPLKPRVEVKQTVKDKAINPTPKVESKEGEKAPALVKSNALGGVNKVNTEEISAYPVNKIKNDNIVVVNKHQKPLFTMNTNEGLMMDPSSKTASVVPSQRRSPLRPPEMPKMPDNFSDNIEKLRESFERNDPGKSPEPTVMNKEPFNADSYSGVALDQLNTNSSNWYLSPSMQRASYRAGGMETGEPNNNFHYSHNNRS
jgi:hypothetical protein